MGIKMSLPPHVVRGGPWLMTPSQVPRQSWSVPPACWLVDSPVYAWHGLQDLPSPQRLISPARHHPIPSWLPLTLNQSLHMANHLEPVNSTRNGRSGELTLIWSWALAQPDINKGRCCHLWTCWQTRSMRQTFPKVLLTFWCLKIYSPSWVSYMSSSRVLCL